MSQRTTGYCETTNVEAGLILWLPKRASIEDQLVLDWGIDSECFNHPIVVLSVQPKDVSSRSATICKITSFGGRGLLDRYDWSPYRRQQYLPISPSPAHPDNDLLLCLEDAKELRKPSYVNTCEILKIGTPFLTPYSRYEESYKLNEESYETLMAYAKYDPPASHAKYRSSRTFVTTQLGGTQATSGSPPLSDIVRYAPPQIIPRMEEIPPKEEPGHMLDNSQVDESAQGSSALEMLDSYEEDDGDNQSLFDANDDVEDYWSLSEDDGLHSDDEDRSYGQEVHDGDEDHTGSEDTPVGEVSQDNSLASPKGPLNMIQKEEPNSHDSEASPSNISKVPAKTLLDEHSKTKLEEQSISPKILDSKSLREIRASLEEFIEGSSEKSEDDDELKSRSTMLAESWIINSVLVQRIAFIHRSVNRMLEDPSPTDTDDLEIIAKDIANVNTANFNDYLATHKMTDETIQMIAHVSNLAMGKEETVGGVSEGDGLAEQEGDHQSKQLSSKRELCVQVDLATDQAIVPMI